ASMTTGNVDATIGCLVNHEVPQMEKEGFEVNYFFPDDFGVPQYYEGIFLASDKMIEEEPDVVAAFLRGCKKGFEDFKAEPDAVLQVLLDNQDASNFPLDPDVEKQSTETLLPLMETADAPFLSQTEQCWQENIDWMYDEGLISKKPEVSEVMATIDF
ncbi:MAG: ABC transporter substrate-binding protein, partial [Butyricicoccus sp.]|nr:ABC transporter substrate-binding protein [Butyricicoccus sp.]